LKLKRDEPLSSFAFKFNLRHYTVVFPEEPPVVGAAAAAAADADAALYRGGWQGASTRPPLSST